MSEGTVDVDETDGALLGLCEYCGELKVLDQLGRCSTPEVEGSPVHCYSCGEPSEFSSSQARKESHARCDACIAARRTQRFKPFEQLARHGEPASLLQAVEEINEELVMTLLEEGIEVDQVRQRKVRADSTGLIWRPVYSSDGRPVPEEDPSLGRADVIYFALWI
ncbi:unnamed protein product [Durusdinium trenchii]|uniref:Uncharacterized protein n=1 Tax=Durusdinium trenchii TaxID=1381693 RepID=A0ABP0J4M9_9DINO